MTLSEKSSSSNKRVNVLGVGISITNMKMAVENICDLAKQPGRNYICVTGVHGVMESQKNDDLKKIHNSSGLTVPDGMPLVWAGKIYGHSDMGRVYGPDLMWTICKSSVKKGFTHFLYGGNKGVAETLKNTLEKKIPGIKIAGTYTPPFRPLTNAEEKDMIKQVNQTKPDFFWVGLSTPKQEIFMSEYILKLDTKVMLGVGAAFDYHTGRVTDSPDWIKRSGMQWLHRLLQDPKRLWKRYLINNPLFVYKFLKQVIFDKLA
ncbi:N-acetylglucosaminyldiphosphoundecaprenol N-acetyl-beta-D-mannosaminyltransferase [Candidatus Magnetomoraceae bacterium gMMP-15]